MARPSLGIQGIEALHYYVHDLERTRRFFVDKLDFVEIGSSGPELEREGRQRSAAFRAGDALTFADLYLVPQLYAARRYAVELAPYPTLTRVEAACAALPAFQAAHPDAQPDKPGV